MSTDAQAATGRIVWHDLVTADLERATAFYTDLLGWELNVYKPGDADYPMIRAGGQEHGGFVRLVGVPPHWHASVLVEDAAASAARAAELGGQIIRPATDIPEAGRFAVLADPQGAVFAVFEAFEPMPAPTGTFLWDELRATDLDEAKRFYSGLFGWASSERDMRELGTYTVFKHGAQDVAGLTSKPDQAPVPHWLTYLATDDVDGTVHRSGGLGATTMMPPKDIPGVGRVAILADPTGAVFGLLKPWP